MMKLILNIAFCVMSVAAFSACVSKKAPEGSDWYQYGARFPDRYGALPVSQVKGGEQNVVVEGTIGEVCKSMGCWLTLRDSSAHELWVQTRDHQFFVPRNAAGRVARVHGRAERAEVSVDQLKHFAMDAGRSQQVIDAITQPITRVTFYADSVIIAGEGLDRAVSPVE
jgi:hypothetical protein